MSERTGRGAFSELRGLRQAWNQELEGEGESLQGAKVEQGVRWWCSATSTPGLEHGGGP